MIKKTIYIDFSTKGIMEREALQKMYLYLEKELVSYLLPKQNSYFSVNNKDLIHFFIEKPEIKFQVKLEIKTNNEEKIRDVVEDIKNLVVLDLRRYDFIHSKTFEKNEEENFLDIDFKFNYFRGEVELNFLEPYLEETINLLKEKNIHLNTLIKKNMTSIDVKFLIKKGEVKKREVIDLLSNFFRRKNLDFTVIKPSFFKKHIKRESFIQN